MKDKYSRVSTEVLTVFRGLSLTSFRLQRNTSLFTDITRVKPEKISFNVYTQKTFDY